MPHFSLNDESDGEDDSKWDYDEEPHPIGFGSAWTRTRVALDIASPSRSFVDGLGRSTYALDDELDFDEALFLRRERQAQSYDLVPSGALLKFRFSDEESALNAESRDEPNADDEDLHFLHSIIKETPRKQPPGTPFKDHYLKEPDVARHIDSKIRKEEQRIQSEHQIIQDEIRRLTIQLEKEANEIRKALEEEEKAAERRNEEAVAQAAAQAAAAETDNLARSGKKQALTDTSASQKRQQPTEPQESKEIAQTKQPSSAEKPPSSSPKAADAMPAYEDKAKKLIKQLTVLRESIEPFDKSKQVSKRRLKMKKIIRGKLNTLSENVSKIREVAEEVAAAISEARAADAEAKGAIERRENGYTPEMARGKRYLLDLLASNTILRVQAEGFNGPRGDGFPLAAMLAMISISNKELVPILAAHVYTVCPIAIPTLPIVKPGASEEELMSSLGMLKNKDGEFESFDRFLSRTENIIAIIGDIMASVPSSHSLFGGHRGAIEWLQRFLHLLPAAPTSPLPLFTAPVIHGFLSAAGHMLANKHADEFKKELAIVVDSILPRLDDGPIGKPSSIRLAKLLDGGFQSFADTLPSKALGELYYGARAVEGGLGGPVQPPQSMHQGFQGGKTQSHPFGKPGGNSGFQGQGNMSNPPTGNSQGMGVASANNPFGNNPSFGNNATNSTPFGNSSSNSTGFGGNFSNASPFGTQSGGSNNWNNSFQQNSNQPPQANNPSPFAPGGQGFSNNGTGFGSSNGGGGGQGFSNSGSGFGSSNGGGGGQGFSNNGMGFGSSDRGGNNKNRRKDNSQQKSKPPCRFFQRGNCRNGDSCKFSHDIASTQGGQNFQGNQTGNAPFQSRNPAPFQQSGGNRGFNNNQSGRSNNPFGGGGW